ncbi:MAG: autotransporter domain-containing protein [Rickettsiaceae bacterium]|nr:autotransporter domain-containing protein [Rickettsiaceae bacterium]
MNTQNNINFNNATLIFSNGSNLTGNNTITDSVINLNDNGGGFTGATQINNSVFNLNSNTLNFTNAGTSSISGSPTFNINIDENNNIGHILVNGGNLDTTGVTQNTLTITLSDLTTKLPVGSVAGIPTSADQYVLFATINGGSVQILNDSKVLFDLSLANNPFVTWTYSNGVLTQIANEPADIDAVLQAIIDANTEEPVSTATAENLTALSELIGDPNNNSQLAQDIVTIAITEPERLDALVSSFQPSDAGASVAEAPPKGMVVQHSLEEIGRRLSNLTSPEAAIVDNDIIEEIGLSAGDGIDGDYSDKPEKHGIWASPFYNIAKHKQKKSEPGYKLRASGVNLGYELMVNEDLSVGFSAGSIQSTIKHTDVNAGDITKSNIYVFSVHGAYELGNNWFTQGVLAYSRNKTKNRELRIIPRGTELATAKYNSNNYSSEFLLGYHHRWQESTIFTTFLGAEYHYLGEVKYTETGTTEQNLLVKRKADNDLELIAGERISYEAVLNEYKIIPYLQGYVRYELINKRGKMNICLNDVNVNLSSRSAEFDRVHYNLGNGVSLQKGNMEYGVSYDLYLAEKYVAHHGSLKLRIKF